MALLNQLKNCIVMGEKIPQKVKPHFPSSEENRLSPVECHHWQSGLVTDAEGHMTPHAPISDHADPTVPDGSDFSPSPLSRPCHRQLRGQSSRESEGQAGSAHRIHRCGEMSGVRL